MAPLNMAEPHLNGGAWKRWPNQRAWERGRRPEAAGGRVSDDDKNYFLNSTICDNKKIQMVRKMRFHA